MALLLSGGARKRALPYFFVAPATAVIALVNLYPMLYSLRLSLSEWPIERLKESPTFVGLSNFQALIGNEALRGAAGFMAFFVIASLLAEFVLGVGIAVLLDQRLPARPLIRSAIVLPIAVAPLVAALTWTYLLNLDYGAVNFVLGRLGIPHVPWLSALPWAQISIVLVDVWQSTPFVAVVVLAGLQAIPEQYREAARIDGASAWQVFWRVTMPLLRPALLVAAVIRTTNAVRMFDLSYGLTAGGPFRSTETFTYLAFQEAFTRFSLPFAAAMSWLIFLLNLAITLLFVRVLYARVEL